METLKKFFPYSFKAKKDIGALIVNILIQFLICAVAGVLIGICAKLPLIGWIIKKLDAIKLDRGGGDVGAIKTTINLAKNGEIVSIFPQGHRYPGVDPATTPIKNGAGMIAYHSACNVLPVCIKTKKDKYHLFGRIEIHFGKPIPNDAFGFANGGSDEYKAATEKIFSEILKLRNDALLPPAVN